MCSTWRKARPTRGHRVGLIVDSTTGGARAEAAWPSLRPAWRSACSASPSPRELSPRDIDALRRVSRRIAALAPDVLHGHGAKGAALARLAPNAADAIRVYTPHGGSLVYCPGTHRRRLLSLAGAAAELAHRSVPVRKQLRRRPVPRQDRHAARHGARRAQRRRRRRIRADRDRSPTPPTSSASANCGRSRRSTC